MIGYDEDIVILFKFNDESEEIDDATDWNNNFHSPEWFMISLSVEQKTTSTIEYSVYINGVKDTNIDSVNANRILANIDSSVEYISGAATKYEGKLDNFMLFNKALNQEEIDFLYNNGNGREDLDDTAAGQVCYRSRRR